MLSIYLSLALSLSRVPGSTTEDSGLYLCDTSIDGDVCESKGMAVYVTYTNPPTRPSTFYPISPSQWNFSETNILKYLNVSSSDAPDVSPKFSGVFTPNQTGKYILQLLVQHSLSVDACSFSMGDNDFFIDADLSYSGTGESYSLSCSVSQVNKTSLCIEYNYCRRQYYFVAGEQYPIYAGARSNYTVPQTDNLWMRLTYTDPSYNNLKITDEAVAGMSGETESEDVLSSKKINVSLIGGAFAGVVIVVAIASVAAWFIIRKVTKKDKPSNSDVVDRREHSGGHNQRRSDRDSRRNGDTRRGDNRSSRHGTRAGSSRSGYESNDHRGHKTKRSKVRVGN